MPEQAEATKLVELALASAAVVEQASHMAHVEARMPLPTGADELPPRLDYAP